MFDDRPPACSLSTRARYRRFRRNTWAAVGVGLLIFWAVVAWLVFG